MASWACACRPLVLESKHDVLNDAKLWASIGESKGVVAISVYSFLCEGTVLQLDEEIVFWQETRVRRGWMARATSAHSMTLLHDSGGGLTTLVMQIIGSESTLVRRRTASNVEVGVIQHEGQKRDRSAAIQTLIDTATSRGNCVP
jgi:hypothetical protein